MSKDELIESIRDIAYWNDENYYSHEKLEDIRRILTKYDTQRVKDELLINLNLIPHGS